MKVKIYQAKLVVEGKEKTLTKSIAKQFPICRTDKRVVDAGKARPPICKIRGETIGALSGWLYLVEDDVAGLAWEPAVVYEEHYAAKMQEAGYHVDDPSQVPTVVL